MLGTVLRNVLTKRSQTPYLYSYIRRNSDAWLSKRHLSSRIVSTFANRLTYLHNHCAASNSYYQNRPFSKKSNMDETSCITPPEWVNKELVEKILREHYDDSTVYLSDFSIKAAITLGDNYSSVLSRAFCTCHVKGEVKALRLIIKTMPLGRIVEESITGINCFSKETKMLREIIPAFEKILERIGHNEPLAPRIIYSSLTPDPIIVMSDLCEEGFENEDRNLGFDVEHCKLVLEKVAIFHATSLVLINERPELKSGDFRKSVWGSNNKGTVGPMIQGGFKTVVKHIDSWTGEKWSDKIASLTDDPVRSLNEVYENDSHGRLAILSHGDLWMNNLMFRSNEQGLYELRFVDLQLCIYLSPVYDIMYFLFSSPRRDVRFKHIDMLLKLYHDALIKYTSLLNVDITYSYEDFIKDYEERLLFGFIIFLSVFPVVSAPKKYANYLCKGVTDFEDSVIFLDDNFKQSFIDGLPYFEAHGLFNKSQ